MHTAKILTNASNFCLTNAAPPTDSYTNIEKGEDFLLYDSGAESGNQRIIIFRTKANVEQLYTAAVWLADGTYKTASRLFYQPYV